MAGGKDEADLATDKVEADTAEAIQNCASIRGDMALLAKVPRDTPAEYHILRQLVANQSVAIIQLTQLVNSVRRESLTYHRDAMKAISRLCD